MSFSSSTAVVGNVGLSTRHASHMRRSHFELTRTQRIMALSLVISSWLSLIVAVVALLTAISARVTVQRGLSGYRNGLGDGDFTLPFVQVQGIPHPLGFCKQHTVDRLKLATEMDPAHLVQNSSAIVAKKSGVYELVISADIINNTCHRMSIMQLRNEEHFEHWIECDNRDSRILSLTTLCIQKDDVLYMPPPSKALLCPPQEPLKLLLKFLANVKC